MSDKSTPLDYEPIRNPRRPNLSREYSFEPEPATLFESKFNSDVSEPSPGSVHAARGVASTQILKRGHTLSFIGLFLFTFLLVFRPYEFSPSLNWLLKGAFVTAIATLLVFIPTQLALENRITVRTREVNLVLLLLLLCLISVPFAADKLRAWNSFVEYMKVIIIFIVMVNVLRTEAKLKSLLLIVIVATCILSFTAIEDFRAGNLALRGARIEGAIGGLFENPNDLALHFVTFLPIIFVLALASRNIISKLIYFTAAAGALAGMIVTFSRGGFLGLIGVVGVLIWKLGKRNLPLVGGITLSLIIVLLLLAPSTYRDRIATTEDGSAIARMGELKRSVFLALRHPVFGVGMDNFVLFSDREQATHNAYTQVASEIGITAAVIYVLFLVTALRRVGQVPAPKDVPRGNRMLPYLATGVQASLVGYMVTSFFASVAFLWYVYYLTAYGICVRRLYKSSVAAESE